jgi:hypothetical protein
MATGQDRLTIASPLKQVKPVPTELTHFKVVAQLRNS